MTEEESVVYEEENEDVHRNIEDIQAYAEEGDEVIMSLMLFEIYCPFLVLIIQPVIVYSALSVVCKTRYVI